MVKGIDLPEDWSRGKLVPDKFIKYAVVLLSMSPFIIFPPEQPADGKREPTGIAGALGLTKKNGPWASGLMHCYRDGTYHVRLYSPSDGVNYDSYYYNRDESEIVRSREPNGLLHTHRLRGRARKLQALKSAFCFIQKYNR